MNRLVEKGLLLPGILAIVAFLVGGAFGQSTVSLEDYKIYSIVLQDIERTTRESERHTTKTFAIIDSTYLPDAYPGRERDSVTKNFLRNNRESATIESRFSTKLRVYLTDEKTVFELIEKRRIEEDIAAKKLLAERGLGTVSTCGTSWKYFYAKYPEAEGYYQFSRVGYSKNRSWAIVEFKGRGECWDSNGWYRLKRTSKGWAVYSAGGGFGVA